MTYYEIAKLRERCLGDMNDNTQDTLLTNFGTQADDQIDNELYISANRNARLTALPALPLSSPPQTIKDASTDRATALFFQQQHMFDVSDRYMAQSKAAVQGYITRLEAGGTLYGVIL